MTTSSQLYPDDTFLFTDDFWLVVQKLYWTCQSTRATAKYGYKRQGLTAQYPQLCTFFDEYFYNNESVRNGFEEKTGQDFLQWTKTKLDDNLAMNLTAETEFGEMIVKYSQANLVMVTAYIGEPFITEYVMDEVYHKR